MVCVGRQGLSVWERDVGLCLDDSGFVKTRRQITSPGQSELHVTLSGHLELAVGHCEVGLLLDNRRNVKALGEISSSDHATGSGHHEVAVGGGKVCLLLGSV
mmetsp:Transcript_5751/g.18150  ORF Transcript_5751/g.18150 Transcript_5751/m.18150 type:complete len:102 (-) Transcript_5751:1744-2049(-)